MSPAERIRNPLLKSKIMSADAAAELIPPGANVGMSGFTGSGYPKQLPAALVKRVKRAQAAGEEFRIGLWTGASIAPELDGVLAEVHGVQIRLPYQSDPTVRKQINSREMQYTEHDVQILVTEQGLADLRGLSPKQRARLIIEKCAHPDYRPALTEYYERALRESPGNTRRT